MSANWNEASKEKLYQINFESYSLETPHKSSMKISREQSGNLINSLTHDFRAEKVKLVNICLSKAKDASNTAVYIGTKCGLSESIVRKVLNGTQKVSLTFIANICVGLELSMEESEELFENFGYKLEFGKGLIESITMCAIRDHDDINEYLETVKELEKEFEKRKSEK